MKEEVIYEPNPPYAVQIGEGEYLRTSSPDKGDVKELTYIDWSSVSFYWDCDEAESAADEVAQEYEFVRVVKRSEK